MRERDLADERPNYGYRRIGLDYFENPALSGVTHRLADTQDWVYGPPWTAMRCVIRLVEDVISGVSLAAPPFAWSRICIQPISTLVLLCRIGSALREVDHGAGHMVEVVHEDVKDDIGYDLDDRSIRQARIASAL
jgi:hypothetical protein